MTTARERLKNMMHAYTLNYLSKTFHFVEETGQEHASWNLSREIVKKIYSTADLELILKSDDLDKDDLYKKVKAYVEKNHPCYNYKTLDSTQMSRVKAFIYKHILDCYNLSTRRAPEQFAWEVAEGVCNKHMGEYNKLESKENHPDRIRKRVSKYMSEQGYNTLVPHVSMGEEANDVTLYYKGQLLCIVKDEFLEDSLKIAKQSFEDTATSYKKNYSKEILALGDVLTPDVEDAATESHTHFLNMLKHFCWNADLAERVTAIMLHSRKSDEEV